MLHLLLTLPLIGSPLALPTYGPYLVPTVSGAPVDVSLAGLEAPAEAALGQLKTVFSRPLTEYSAKGEQLASANLGAILRYFASEQGPALQAKVVGQYFHEVTASDANSQTSPQTNFAIPQLMPATPFLYPTIEGGAKGWMFAPVASVISAAQSTTGSRASARASLNATVALAATPFGVSIQGGHVGNIAGHTNQDDCPAVDCEGTSSPPVASATAESKHDVTAEAEFIVEALPGGEEISLYISFYAWALGSTAFGDNEYTCGAKHANSFSVQLEGPTGFNSGTLDMTSGAIAFATVLTNAEAGQYTLRIRYRSCYELAVWACPVCPGDKSSDVFVINEAFGATVSVLNPLGSGQ